MGRKACWTLTILRYGLVRQRRRRPAREGVPEDIDVEDLVPAVQTFPGRTLGADAGIVHEDGNLQMSIECE